MVGLDPLPHRPSYAARIMYLVASMPTQAFLGMVLLSGHPYPYYVLLPPPWGGAAAVQDLGNGAALMWTAGGLASLVAVLLVAAAWFRNAEARQLRIEAEMDAAAAAARANYT